MKSKRLFLTGLIGSIFTKNAFSQKIDPATQISGNLQTRLTSLENQNANLISRIESLEIEIEAISFSRDWTIKEFQVSADLSRTYQTEPDTTAVLCAINGLVQNFSNFILNSETGEIQIKSEIVLKEGYSIVFYYFALPLP